MVTVFFFLRNIIWYGFFDIEKLKGKYCLWFNINLLYVKNFFWDGGFCFVCVEYKKVRLKSIKFYDKIVVNKWILERNRLDENKF